MGKRSKLLHLATICSFLLPFYYTGCGKVETPEAADRVVVTDTSYVLADTVYENSGNLITVGQTNAKNKEPEKLLSEVIAEKIPSIGIVLKPKQDTYSGIGSIINVSKYFIFMPY